jgi:hypothetical protein
VADPRTETAAEALHGFEGGGSWQLALAEDADYYHDGARLALAAMDRVAGQASPGARDPRREAVADALYRYEGGEQAWSRVLTEDANYYRDGAQEIITALDERDTVGGGVPK